MRFKAIQVKVLNNYKLYLLKPEKLHKINRSLQQQNYKPNRFKVNQ